MSSGFAFIKVGGVAVNFDYVACIRDDGDTVRLYLAHTPLPEGHVEFAGDDAAQFRLEMGKLISAARGGLQARDLSSPPSQG